MILLETSRIYKHINLGPQYPPEEFEEGEYLAAMYKASQLKRFPNDHESPFYKCFLIHETDSSFEKSKESTIVNIIESKVVESERLYSAFIEHCIPLFTSIEIRDVKITRVVDGYIVDGVYISNNTY